MTFFFYWPHVHVAYYKEAMFSFTGMHRCLVHPLAVSLIDVNWDSVAA